MSSVKIILLWSAWRLIKIFDEGFRIGEKFKDKIVANWALATVTLLATAATWFYYFLIMGIIFSFSLVWSFPYLILGGGAAVIFVIVTEIVSGISQRVLIYCWKANNSSVRGDWV